MLCNTAINRLLLSTESSDAGNWNDQNHRTYTNSQINYTFTAI